MINILVDLLIMYIIGGLIVNWVKDFTWTKIPFIRRILWPLLIIPPYNTNDGLIGLVSIGLRFSICFIPWFILNLIGYLSQIYIDNASYLIDPLNRFIYGGEGAG